MATRVEFFVWPSRVYRKIKNRFARSAFTFWLKVPASTFHARLNLVAVTGRDSFLFHSVYRQGEKTGLAIMISQLHWNLIGTKLFLLFFFRYKCIRLNRLKYIRNIVLWYITVVMRPHHRIKSERLYYCI